MRYVGLASLLLLFAPLAIADEMPLGISKTKPESGRYVKIEQGYIADLVAIGADPRSTLGGFRDPELVVLRGRLLERDELFGLVEATIALQDGVRELMAQPVQVELPSLKELDGSELLMDGHAENLAFSRRVSGERFGVYRFPDGRLAYATRVIIPESFQVPGIDVQILQVFKGDRLDEFRFLSTPQVGDIPEEERGEAGTLLSEALPEITSPSGAGFLSEVCIGCEEAAEPAAAAGIRVVHLRLGVVLDARGGALKKMLLPFQLGAGGRLGSGKQPMSWVALDDVLGIVLHALATEDLSGPVNAVAPDLVDNAGYTATLARVLRRPAIAPVPSPVVSTLFGEMGRELLLGGAPVVPGRLLSTGYDFRHGSLEDALRHTLGRR